MSKRNNREKDAFNGNTWSVIEKCDFNRDHSKSEQFTKKELGNIETLGLFDLCYFNESSLNEQFTKEELLTKSPKTYERYWFNEFIRGEKFTEQELTQSKKNCAKEFGAADSSSDLNANFEGSRDFGNNILNRKTFDEISKEDMRAMQLHEMLITPFGIAIMKVASGWIYDCWDMETDNFKTGIFIPIQNK